MKKMSNNGAIPTVAPSRPAGHVARFINRAKAALLRRVAAALRPHLAQTPMIWGDASRVHIGKDVALTDVILNCRSGQIIIEDNVFFGHGCMVLAGRHDTKKLGIERQDAVPQFGFDVVIRAGAWIASGAILIGPCEIGENAVIPAGMVVPPRTIVAANTTFGTSLPKTLVAAQ